MGIATAAFAGPVAADAAGTCRGTNAVPDEQNMSKVRASVLCLVNRTRRAHGLHELTVQRHLQRAAARHSDRMVSSHVFFNTTPTGLRQSGYIDRADRWALGENVAWGTSLLATPMANFRAWMRSPEHRVNILRARFRETGIGVTLGVPSLNYAGRPGATYTQEFGARE